MTTPKFSLDSNQLELLVAMHTNPSLTHLAKTLRRDPSVVSRNIARLAESAPVIEKHDRRWRVTALGKKLAVMAESFMAEMRDALKKEDSHFSKAALHIVPSTALLIVNAQKVMQSPTLGEPSNPLALSNSHKLLATWHRCKMPVIYAKHYSESIDSMFHRTVPMSEFITELQPAAGDHVVEKYGASSFTGGELAKLLDRHEIHSLVVVGFTANECIDATAKQAVAMGYGTTVVNDGIAQFDLVAPSGRIHKAKDVHEIVILGLSNLAVVADTKDVLAALR